VPSAVASPINGVTLHSLFPTLFQGVFKVFPAGLNRGSSVAEHGHERRIMPSTQRPHRTLSAGVDKVNTPPAHLEFGVFDSGVMDYGHDVPFFFGERDDRRVGVFNAGGVV
jgi:hypothetical protein